MMTDDIHISRIGAVGRIAINRPQTMNALRESTFRGLQSAVAELAADPSVRALLLAGTGRAFCSGADLSDPMMGTNLPADQRPDACRQTLDTIMNAAIRAIRTAPVPTVTAVNGVAAGGGVGLALTADMVIAARSARFVVAFTPKLGLIPDLGTSWHLARHLGRARALGVVLSGEAIDAEAAARMGLIWKAVADDALEQEALALAERLASGPIAAQLRARALIDTAFDQDFNAQLDAERDAQASLVAGEEPSEAVRAFLEKRAPNFAAVPRKP